MTIKERLTGLLLDNGVDPDKDDSVMLISDDEYDASTEVILEINQRINKLEKSVRYLMEISNARR